MTIHEAQQQLIARLQRVYEGREAATMADWVLEHLTGWKKIDRLVRKHEALSPQQLEKFSAFIEDLVRHRPVQYVLEEAWFYGLPFYVNEAVLIPRPETEELVEWILKDVAARNPAPPMQELRILDIGTGSGCIPVALKKNLPEAIIDACDISEAALAVARRNAQTLEASVNFIQLDILDAASWDRLPALDIIVSNPPYIPFHNKASMQPNVLEYEPHLALFVSNEDPLQFYRVIAELARQKLLPGGTVYVEIHEDLGAATSECFIERGFSKVHVRKDLQGKDRMVRSTKE